MKIKRNLFLFISWGLYLICFFLPFIKIKGSDSFILGYYSIAGSVILGIEFFQELDIKFDFYKLYIGMLAISNIIILLSPLYAPKFRRNLNGIFKWIILIFASFSFSPVVVEGYRVLHVGFYAWSFSFVFLALYFFTSSEPSRPLT